MKADDARHGTEAGRSQHRRDNEAVCDECHQASVLANRRRGKRKTQGAVFTVTLGPAHAVVARWHAGGASIGGIASLIGVPESLVIRILRGDESTPVRTATRRKILAAVNQSPLTADGAMRRLQALAWMGHSARSVAAITGLGEVHLSRVRDGRIRPRDMHVLVAIAKAYEDLHMRLPTGHSKGVTRNQNMARRLGWLPPMAYDDIDMQVVARSPSAEADDLDPVLVERILNGDMTLARVATKAEKAEVVRRWTGVYNELERLTGWNVNRFKREVA